MSFPRSWQQIGRGSGWICWEISQITKDPMHWYDLFPVKSSNLLIVFPMWISYFHENIQLYIYTLLSKLISDLFFFPKPIVTSQKLSTHVRRRVSRSFRTLTRVSRTSNQSIRLLQNDMKDVTWARHNGTKVFKTTGDAFQNTWGQWKKLMENGWKSPLPKRWQYKSTKLSFSTSFWIKLAIMTNLCCTHSNGWQETHTKVRQADKETRAFEKRTCILIGCITKAYKY